MTTSLMVATLLVAASPNVAADSTWSGFRNGGSSQASCDKLPISWSPNFNIAWQRELPGYGQSAPVALGGIVYVTAVVGPQKERCLVTALDAASGQEQWRSEQIASTNMASNYAVARAAPTPLVDARGVY